MERIERKWFTVGELVEELRKLPPEYQVNYDNDCMSTSLTTIQIDRESGEIELS